MVSQTEVIVTDQTVLSHLDHGIDTYSGTATATATGIGIVAAPYPRTKHRLTITSPPPAHLRPTRISGIVAQSSHAAISSSAINQSYASRYGAGAAERGCAKTAAAVRQPVRPCDGCATVLSQSGHHIPKLVLRRRT